MSWLQRIYGEWFFTFFLISQTVGSVWSLNFCSSYKAASSSCSLKKLRKLSDNLELWCIVPINFSHKFCLKAFGVWLKIYLNNSSFEEACIASPSKHLSRGDLRLTISGDMPSMSPESRKKSALKLFVSLFNACSMRLYSKPKSLSAENSRSSCRAYLTIKGCSRL